MTDATIAARSTADFAIRPVEGRVGDYEVELDGQRIEEHLKGISIDMQARELPSVVLELAPTSTRTVAFEGLARVEIGTPADPGPAAAAFLAAIDAETLEDAALARQDLGNGPHALTAAMLRQLVEWASGRS